MFVGHLYIFFGEMPVEELCPFLNWVVWFFSCWVLRVLYIFWILILIRYVICKYFPCSVGCLFTDSVLWYTKLSIKSNLYFSLLLPVLCECVSLILFFIVMYSSFMDAQASLILQVYWWQVCSFDFYIFFWSLHYLCFHQCHYFWAFLFLFILSFMMEVFLKCSLSFSSFSDLKVRY